MTVDSDPQLFLGSYNGLLFVFVGNPAIFTRDVGSRPKSILRVCLWHGKAKAVWIAGLRGVKIAPDLQKTKISLDSCLPAGRFLLTFFINGKK